MTTLAGVDGCRAGWVAVVAARGMDLQAFVCPRFADLLRLLPSSTLFAVDIPIGLLNQGARACDVDARKLLGKQRAASVFTAPSRCWLSAQCDSEASRLRYATEGKKVSRQAYGILRKVCEIDALLRESSDLRKRVIEVHPEVSFCAWLGAPMSHNKKKAEGRQARETLIDAHWPDARVRLWQSLKGADLQRDDLNDAFAALWSAERYISAAATVTLPRDRNDVDAYGIPMRIVA